MKHVSKLFLALIFTWVSLSAVNAATPASTLDYCCKPGSLWKFGGAYATFAGKFGGDVNQNDLKNTTQVGVAGCAEGSLIYQFDLHIYSKGNESVFKGESHILTNEMRDSLGSLKEGDSFEFMNIKAKLPAGGKVDVVGKIFKVV